MKKRSYSILFLILIIASSLFQAQSGVENSPEKSSDICYSCFWQYQEPELKKKLIEFYSGYAATDFFMRGEVAFMLGNLKGDESLIKDSVAFYNLALMMENDPFRKMLLNEITGMLAPHAALDPAVYFRNASKLSAKLGMKWRSTVMSSLARGGYTPSFEDVKIAHKLTVPPNAKYFVLGESSIRVRKGARVGVQLERTFRDWLSSQFRYDFSENYARLANVLDYHEGARLADLMEYAEVRPIALAGTILAYKAGKWYAPDEKGIFRFIVLDDKVQYPTTKQHENIALMLDTHGISAVVEQAVRERTDLVIACGDNPPKAEAAYYLAKKGIPVYFPCDREIGMLLGQDGNAVILGTAPIRKTAEGAVIGAQPVRFSIDETIVIEDIEQDFAGRYYDSAARYFRALHSFIPLNLHTVRVSGLKETFKVVRKAEELGAKAIGVRVAYDEDYEAVKEWLQSSRENRVVLFHSAPYPPGYRLFFEFPDQVTFGDPKPRFIAID